MISQNNKKAGYVRLNTHILPLFNEKYVEKFAI